MKKLINFLGLIFITVGCGPTLGDYYFNFDSIDYYSISIADHQLLGDQINPSLTELQTKVILGNTPLHISDTLFINGLRKGAFKHKEIPRNRYPDIKEIFREKSSRNYSETKCLPVYRDIIIFKKRSKIIGVAKVCFDCGKNIIIGTDANTTNFGQDDDYSALAKILYQQ